MEAMFQVGRGQTITSADRTWDPAPTSSSTRESCLYVTGLFTGPKETRSPSR